LKPEKLLLVTPYALALSGFYITVGTKWNAEKVLPLVAGFFLLLNVFATRRLQSNRLLSHVVIVCTLFIVASTILGAFYYPEIEISTTTMQTPFVRAVIRGISYEVALIYFIMPVLLLPMFKDKLLPARFFVYPGLVLFVYGAYQILAHKLGLPYRGIKYWEGQFGFGAMETLGGMFRANGLANEPKQMSMYCLTAAICSFLLAGGWSGNKKFRIFALLCFLGFLMTLSGSGLLAAISLMVAGTVVASFQKRKATSESLTVIWPYLILLVLMLFLFNKSDHAFTFLKSTTVDRVSLAVPKSGRTDNYVVALIAEKPLFLLTGFGMGNHPFWTYERFGVGTSAFSGVQAADSGWLNLLCDFSIIGLLFFGFWLAKVMRNFLNTTNESDLSEEMRKGMNISFYSFLAAFFLNFFTGSLNVMLFWLGMLHTYTSLAKNEVALHRNH
jgi:hypothetical protein